MSTAPLLASLLSQHYKMLKKVARRLMHPVFGRTLQFFKTYVARRPAIPRPSHGHPSQLLDPHVSQQAEHGSQGATHRLARQKAIERRARREEEAKRAQALRRAHALRPIPGTFTYNSFNEFAPPHLPRPPLATTQLPAFGVRATRASGSFKRSKPLASAPVRQQSQKHRSVRNLVRRDAAKGLPVDGQASLPDANAVLHGMSPGQFAKHRMTPPGLTVPDASRPRCSGRYGLFAEDSQDSSSSVYVLGEGGYRRDEEAKRKEKESRDLKEEEARRKEEERRRENEANCSPFRTHARKSTGRRVVSTVYQPPHLSHPSPTFDPLVNRDQHAEFLRKARRAEENERRAKEEAARIREFQRRISHLRLQQDEDEAWERLKRKKLERQRLNATSGREGDIDPSMNIHGTPDSMDIDQPLTVQDRFDIYEKKWNTLIQKGARNLSFLDMPWPVLCDARDISSLTPVNIEVFVLHNFRRAARGRGGLTQLIKEDILLWHPDRFAKFRKSISQPQWSIIQQGVNIVAQVLIEMKENVARFA